MSASVDEIKSLLIEADNRGDRANAMALMDKLDSIKEEESLEVEAQPQTHLDKFSDTMENIGERVKGRGEEVAETLEKHATGEIGTLRAGTEILGKGVVGTTFDVVGETAMMGLSEFVDQTGNFVSVLVPDAIEEPVKAKAKETLDWLVKSEAGQFISNEIASSVEGGAEAYKMLKEKYPAEMKTAESVANIAMMFAPVKVKAKSDPSFIGKGADALKKSADKSITRRRTGFVEDLVKPVRTQKIKLEETARTVELGTGPFKRSIVKPTARELEMAAEVNKIKAVTPKNTTQGNLNAIYAENERLAVSLGKTLDKRRVLIPSSEAARSVDDAVAILVKENPVVVGNAETVAKRVAAKANQILGNHPSTPKGILSARKEFDSWILTQKGQKAFDPAMENALSVSVRAVRRSMNSTVEKYAPSANVKARLKQQNLLYETIDNIGPKAAATANNAIGRAWQRAVAILPFRGVINQEMALVLGMGGLGAAATIAPWLRGALTAGAVTYGAGRIIISPKVRQTLSVLLKMTDRAIISSKHPSVIRQLRADRAVIRDLIKNAEVSEEQETQ